MNVCGVNHFGINPFILFIGEKLPNDFQIQNNAEINTEAWSSIFQRHARQHMEEMVIKRTTKTTHQNASSHSTIEVKGTRDVSTREKMPPGVTLIRNLPGPLTESHGDIVSLILVTGQVSI